MAPVGGGQHHLPGGNLIPGGSHSFKLFTGLFLQDDLLLGQASSSIRMYTLALLGVAVQYALVDGLTAMGKV